MARAHAMLEEMEYLDTSTFVVDAEEKGDGT